MVAVDLRGFGKSSYQSQCFKLEDWANDVIDFCTIKNIKSCILNGWSFGGGVSMKIAELAPHLVHKLILTCSVPHDGMIMLKGIGKSP